MARSFNLLMFTGHPTDATTFYRCTGPLNALRPKRPGLTLDIPTEINWATVCRGDAAIFQRPTTPNHLEIARMCVRQGLPIWVEFDDDFFGIPLENPHHDEYMKAETHLTIRKIVALADVVTVTTPDLAKVFGELHKDVRIVPNALMTNMVGPVPDHDARPRMNMVMWRGSKTHQIDLDAYHDTIVAVAKDHPSIPWAFQGYATPRILSDIGARANRGAMLDNIEYFAVLAAVRPKVLMVPLAEHRFNRSKSNIAGLEATFAGAIPLVPDWPDWQVPGWLKYVDQESFKLQLTKAIAMPHDEVVQRWSAAKRHIDGHLTIDIVNAKRNRILDELERASADQMFRVRKRDVVAPRRADA